ncbi:SRPBCC domain-containing protein [Mucilaginibacter sp. AW1-3]
MDNQNFNVSFLFDQSPEQVFNAVNNVAGWWSATVQGGTHKLNDEFVYRHGDVHYSKQKLTEVVPNKKVVWLVTDSELTFIEDKAEWTGTRVIFEITQQDGKTRLNFTHEGLVPQGECYSACTGPGGWPFYLHSLSQLITTGKGHPDEKA